MQKSKKGMRELFLVSMHHLLPPQSALQISHSLISKRLIILDIEMKTYDRPKRRFSLYTKHANDSSISTFLQLLLCYINQYNTIHVHLLFDSIFVLKNIQNYLYS